MLECRLDNVVYRLGLANSRNAARQYVSHGHVTVNGKKLNIPSAQVKPGDVVAMKPSARAQQLGLRALDLTQAVVVPSGSARTVTNSVARSSRIPSREEIDPIVNEQLVVELYSR